MIDAHCHILPGVDDGARNIEQSEEILSNLHNYGIDKVVCTSHIKGHTGSLEANTAAFKQIEPIAKKHNIKIALGHEVSWRNLLDIGYENAKNYTFGNSNFFLLEFSINSMPNNWQSIVYALQGEGLEVIIAHPERYIAIQHNLSIAEELKSMGCYTMLSANFISRSWMLGTARKCAKKLLKAELVDFICSDAHSIQHYQYLESAFKFAQKYGFDNKQNNILASVFK